MPRSIVSELPIGAPSVVYNVGGRSEEAKARQEIILAAGAYNSPKILMLSGIGDGEQLQNIGIEPVLNNSQVGANLQDHPALPIDYRRLGECMFHKNLRLDRLTLNMLKAWFLGTGPATDPASFSTGFFKSRREIETPDIQLFLRLFSPQAREWFREFILPILLDLGLFIATCDRKVAAQ